MRVLIAADYLHFPQGGGGLERNTHELCLRLIQHGVFPGVMCQIHHDHSLLEYKNRVLRGLRRSVRFPMDIGLGYPVFRGWKIESGVDEVVSRFKPDVIIVQSGNPDIVKSFEDVGLPRMAYFHEVENMEYVDALMQMGGIGLLANSEFTARKMEDRAGYHPTVIRPLIDPSLYITKTTPQNALFINTSLKKGVETVFQLAESRPDVQFDVVKTSNLSAAKYRLAWPTEILLARTRAAGNITLHEPSNDLRYLYGRARLLLVPSIWEESWGRVATEAQINGIPVLASNRGGLPESVGHGGLLVDHDASIERWKEAFSTMWDDINVYERYSSAACVYRNRLEIRPEIIVTLFIKTIADFIANKSIV